MDCGLRRAHPYPTDKPGLKPRRGFSNSIFNLFIITVSNPPCVEHYAKYDSYNRAIAALVERQIPDIHQNRPVFEASTKLCTGVDPPKESRVKNTPNIFAPPGGRHLEIQYGRHFGLIFSYNSKTKAGRNILFVANPHFKGQGIP